MIVQPARRLLREHGYTVPGIARRYGLNGDHLRNALRGLTAPSHEMKVALTDALDMPITELFTPDKLR